MTSYHKSVIVWVEMLRYRLSVTVECHSERMRGISYLFSFRLRFFISLRSIQNDIVFEGFCLLLYRSISKESPYTNWWRLFSLFAVKEVGIFAIFFVPLRNDDCSNTVENKRLFISNSRLFSTSWFLYRIILITVGAAMSEF